MKQQGNIGKTLTSILLVLVLASCATVTDRYRTERLYDEEKRPTYRNSAARLKLVEREDGSVTGSLTSSYMPAITLSGDVEAAGAGFRFYVTEIELFSNWPNGWTKGKYEGTGIFNFEPVPDGWRFSVTDPLELWEITKGEIRYYDTYYRKDEGLWKVRSRIDRLFEISRFLQEEKSYPRFYHRFLQKPKKGTSFSADIVPFLFPEAKRTFSFKEQRWMFRDDYNDLEAPEYDERETGAGVFWSAAYSEEILPEHLRTLRDSGTMFRDYEEAGLLFYSMYNIEHVINSVLPETVFIQEP